MQVLVAATSSKVDELILIETTTTIGDQVTTQRVGYSADELMDNRYLSGDLEHRIECLRIGAESMTIKAVELHFRTLMKVLAKKPEVVEVGAQAEAVTEPVKKTRAPRKTKTTTTESK
ncbi:hypothetical protein Kompost2_00015 [Pseudomonas phage vB_PpuP-Kompost-2]